MKDEKQGKMPRADRGGRNASEKKNGLQTVRR